MLETYNVFALVPKCMCNVHPTPFPLHIGVKHVGETDVTFACVFGYADERALVSPYLSGLRQMIQICEQYAIEYSIVLTLSNQS